MHELSIIKALIKSVEEYQSAGQADKVKSLSIELGNMTCVDANNLLFCFDMVKHDAGLSNTDLCIHLVKARAVCLSCGNQFELRQIGKSCKCGSYKHDLLSGNELTLTEIEFV